MKTATGIMNSRSMARSGLIPVWRSNTGMNIDPNLNIRDMPRLQTAQQVGQ